MRTSKLFSRVILPVALAIFGCKKPEPEKTCVDKDRHVVECPMAISIVKKEIACADSDGSVTIKSGKKFGKNQPIGDLNVSFLNLDDDLFQLSFTNQAGTTGDMKTLSCRLSYSRIGAYSDLPAPNYNWAPGAANAAKKRMKQLDQTGQ